MRNNRKQEEARLALPLWLILSLGVLVLGILAGGYLFYHAQEQHLWQVAETDLQAIAQLKVDQIAAWRAEQLGDAGVLTESFS